jgi:hypothetical protein
MRERERERMDDWVWLVCSLGMLGEGGDRKKEQTWDAEREREIVWSCWVNSLVAPRTPTYLISTIIIFYNFFCGCGSGVEDLRSGREG